MNTNHFDKCTNVCTIDNNLINTDTYLINIDKNLINSDVNNTSYNFILYQIFKLIFSLLTGSSIALFIVSYYLYYPIKEKFNKLYNENKDYYEYNPFLIQYIDEYYELEEIKDNDYLKSLNNKYLNYSFDFNDENYKIIMNYNFENESFDYFLNIKSYILPFEFLDTIARIYCVKYNCKNIYIDNYDNKASNYSELSESEELSPHPKQEDKNSKIFYSKNNKQKAVNKPKNYIANKFKYKGLLKEFTDIFKDYDIYNNNNILVENYEKLDTNEIFSIKKYSDFEIIEKNQQPEGLSFKDFKKSNITLKDS
tara:strand:+ start:2671 stop:3600 length:930 start_codon:yes stop_codon:yes gene_type:complete